MVDRIDAASHDGFAAIEVQSPYQVEAAEFRRATEAARAQLVLINAPVGDFAGGERGLGGPAGPREGVRCFDRAGDRLRARDRSAAQYT